MTPWGWVDATRRDVARTQRISNEVPLWEKVLVNFLIGSTILALFCVGIVVYGLVYWR